MQSTRYYAFRAASAPPSEEELSRLDQRQTVDAILKWYYQNFEEAPHKEDTSDVPSDVDFYDCEEVLEEALSDYVSASTLSLVASYLNESKAWVPARSRMEAEEGDEEYDPEEAESVAGVVEDPHSIFEEDEEELISFESNSLSDDEDITSNDSLEVALQKLSRKLNTLEAAFNATEEARRRRTHNNPPDELLDASLTDSDRELLKECIAELRNATASGKVQQDKVERATSSLTYVANKFGAWVGRRTEDFSGAFSKRMGDRTADLVYLGIGAAIFHTLLTDVVAAAHQVLLLVQAH